MILLEIDNYRRVDHEMEVTVMQSRQARRRLRKLSHLPMFVTIGLFVLLSFVYTAHSAAAASSRVDVMVLNGDSNPATQQFLTNTLHTAQAGKWTASYT
jgi:hypothetical protein